MANLLLYVLAVRRPPRRLFDWALKRVHASSTPQKEYPKIGIVLRSLSIGKRGLDHLRFMDFSIIPGWSGDVLWRLGIVDAWRNRFLGKFPRPAERPAPTTRLGVGKGNALSMAEGDS